MTEPWASFSGVVRFVDVSWFEIPWAQVSSNKDDKERFQRLVPVGAGDGHGGGGVEIISDAGVAAAASGDLCDIPYSMDICQNTCSKFHIVVDHWWPKGR